MCCLKDLIWCIIFGAFSFIIGLLMLVIYLDCLDFDEHGFECPDYWDRVLNLFLI